MLRTLLPFIFYDLKQMLFIVSKIWSLGLKLRLVISYNLYVQTEEGNISMIISGYSYCPEALNIRLQCLVPLNKMVKLNTSIVPFWKRQRPCTKLLVFHLPSGKMQWKYIALHIYNRQPMHHLDWSPPISKWNGKTPDVSYCYSPTH